MKKKKTRSQLIKELDKRFSVYIRLRDCDKKWIVKCPLCWSKNHRKKSQNMHFITRWNYKYRRDEKNCYWWCMRCNVILNWNYQKYTMFMIKKYWIDKVQEMINDKWLANIKTYELEEKIEYYKDFSKMLLELKLNNVSSD